MMQVTIHEAKTHLSRILKQALSGEEVVIAKGNEPLVKLVPVDKRVSKRRLGGKPGLIKFIADDFDEELKDFENYMP